MKTKKKKKYAKKSIITIKHFHTKLFQVEYTDEIPNTSISIYKEKSTNKNKKLI